MLKLQLIYTNMYFLKADLSYSSVPTLSKQQIVNPHLRTNARFALFKVSTRTQWPAMLDIYEKDVWKHQEMDWLTVGLRSLLGSWLQYVYHF